MTGGAGNEYAGPTDSPRLFDRIARRYDAMNRLMSLGQDQRWRGLAADALALPPRGRVVDVGVGTGDMAVALLERWPDATVIGLDPTRAMMRIARRKLERPSGSAQTRWLSESPVSIPPPVGLVQGDGLLLPFPDYHFDAAVSAFVLRNVVDVEQALAEQCRVVRNEGRVACLEMSWPRTPVLATLFRFYFADLMPRLTGLLSGQPAAYRYLPRSVQRFLTPEELVRTMEQVGMRDVRCRKLALGAVTLHVGTRAG